MPATSAVESRAFVVAAFTSADVFIAAGLSRTTVAANVTINNLLPGRFMTDRLRSNFAAEAKKKGITVEQAEAAARQSIPAQRFGDEMEFGQYCAWLCSQQASYVTGQNLLIDGGNYPGTF